MKDEGNIIDIAKYEDEFRNVSFRVVVEFKNMPEFKLGHCKLEQ